MPKILCIVDGMSDSGFCADDYPALASFPERGFINTVPHGFEAETLPCVLSLLGVKRPPRNMRGWIEAIGAGEDINTDDLVLRGSWVSLDKKGVCTGFCDAPENIPYLERVRYIPLGGYKCILIIPGYSAYASSMKMAMPFDMLGKKLSGKLSPLPVLNDTVARINGMVSGRTLIPWAPSSAKAMPDFSEKGAIVCGTNVVRGIARALNLRLITETGMTGDTDTDLNAKLYHAIELANDYPFVMLHIGGCDEAAHRMSKKEKRNFLAKIDSIVLAGLLRTEYDIEVASDHGSDPLTAKHTAERQPFFRRTTSVIADTIGLRLRL